MKKGSPMTTLLIAIVAILALGVASLVASHKPAAVPIVLIGMALLFMF